MDIQEKRRKEKDKVEEDDGHDKFKITQEIIIGDKYPPEKFSEEDYPLHKYFILTKYSNIDLFKEVINNNYHSFISNISYVFLPYLQLK